MTPCDVLVVDDDPDGRDALAQVLEANGCTVRQAENGRIALDMIAERLPSIMILDLEMPVMSGWDVLASLERTGALGAMRVVVVSGGTIPPPGVAFLRKPCRADHLFGMMESAIASGGASRSAGRP